MANIITTSGGSDQLLMLAIQILGGRMIVPTHEALRAIGWTGTDPASISIRRRAGELPLAEIKIGARYFVTAAAVADAVLRAPGTVVPAPAPRRGPGRPSKGANAGVTP